MYKFMKFKILSHLNNIKSIYKIRITYLRVQIFDAKESISEFQIRNQTNQIFSNVDNTGSNVFEDTITMFFLSLPLLGFIWMYLFYRWPAYHPELFAIAIGLPLCIISIRLIRFIKQRRQN